MNSTPSVHIIKDDFRCIICNKKLDRENDLFTIDSQSGVVCNLCSSINILQKRITRLEKRVENIDLPTIPF
jgi:DNA-directed RNA polymerase subunit RPC12/RpoP